MVIIRECAEYEESISKKDEGSKGGTLAKEILWVY